MGKRRTDPPIPRSRDPSIPRPVIIAVHVQPRAARTEVVGMHGDAVKVRLRAPPVDGAANDELLRFMATRLGVRRQDLEIVSGATARGKRVRVSGTFLNEEDVVRRFLGSDNADGDAGPPRVRRSPTPPG
jgi:hypothetical protein